MTAPLLVERDTLKDIIRELLAEHERSRRCLLEEAGISLEEHKDQHKMIHKLIQDMTSVRKAFLMGVVTTITGGIFGLIWWYIRLKWGEFLR